MSLFISVVVVGILVVVHILVVELLSKFVLTVGRVFIVVGSLVTREITRILNDLLPLLANFLVLNLRQTLINRFDQIILFSAERQFKRFLNHKVAVAVTDEGIESWRVSDLSDELQASGIVSILEALFDDTGGVLLITQFEDLVGKSFKDRFAHLWIPLLDDLADCIVAERIRNEPDQVVQDLLNDALLLASRSRHGNYDFDHAKAVFVQTEFV